MLIAKVIKFKAINSKQQVSTISVVIKVFITIITSCCY